MMEGNEIIFRYEGWYPALQGEWWREDEAKIEVMYALPEYNSNWNTLIPVVRKVMAELNEMGRILDSQDDERCRDCDIELEGLEEAITTLDIDVVYKHTIEAIKLLNKLKEDGRD